MAQYKVRTSNANQGQYMKNAGSRTTTGPLQFGRSGKGTANDVRIALRWQPNIDMTGKYMIVTSAYIRVTRETEDTGAFTATVRVHNGSAPDLSTTDLAWGYSDIGYSQSWSIADSWSADTEFTSPDMKSAVQAWFNRSAHSSTDWIGFIIDDGDSADDEYKGVYDADHSTSSYRPELEINYKIYSGGDNGGLSFTASSSQYLESVSNITPPATSSVSFWIYLTELNQFGRTISRFAYEIGLSDNAGSPPNGIVNAMTSGTILVSSSLTVNTLYHCVCTASSTARQIYLNGVLNTSGGGGTVSTAGTMWIGSQDGVDFFLSGHLEDIRIYNRILTLAEVQTIYACQGSDSITYGLIHRWLMNEGPISSVASGTGLVKDYGINQVNMTPFNSPVFLGTQMKNRNKYRTH